MERFLFFLVIAGILATIYIMTQVDGFQDSGLVVPLAGPPVAQLPGEAQPFNPPSAALLAPPPGQIASVGSKPYQDPAMQKASANRINNAYVTLQGFLENEAPNIQSLGDPSVQLPLATARSDAHRLNDEILVLKRNPGLESSLTVQDVNAIEANLGYLQKKWRLSTNSVVEPFQADPKNSFYSFFSGWFSREPFQDVPEASAAAKEEAVEEAPVEEEAVEATAVPDSMPITVNDLNNLSSRIGVEIVRLNASGSTDPVIQSRVNTLTEIKTKVDDIASQVQQGYKQIEEVPLTQSDISTFLPIMSNLNSPVPQILNTTGMNPVLQNLFQTYSGGDMDGAKFAQEMFDKYAGQLLNNISWDFNISYIGKAEQDIARDEASSAMSIAQIAMSEMAPPSSFPGQFQSITQAMGGPGSAIFNKGPSGQASSDQASSRIGSSRIGSSRIGSSRKPSSDTGYPKPPDPSRPSPYDWKKRTSHICQQVAARGMTPADFGCVEPSSVSDNFSWRGNAKMICNRIATLYDPSIPAACGCPPVSWPGWRA